MPIGGGNQKPPPAVKQNPFTPGMPEPLTFEAFQGINTSTTRPGVPDEQAYWLDGFMPIAKRNLRTLYGVGSSINPGFASAVVFFHFFTLGTSPYMAVVLADGSVQSINTAIGPSSAVTILPAGTIASPTIVGVGFSQWGREYLIIVADQTDGYWLWNGTEVFTAGTLAPLVTITNVGSAYKTTPNVIITGGHGSGAVIVAAIDNGVVTGATVTNPGSGYQAGDSVVLTFSGGNSGGTGGTLTAIMSGGTGGTGGSLTAILTDGHVTSVSIVNGGSGYSVFAVATPSGGTPIISATFQLTVTGGAITAVSIIERGTYSTAPTITVTDSGYAVVSSVTVNSAGSGYSDSAFITFSGGSGPVSQASGELHLNAGGSITSVTVTSGGAYGSVSPVPIIAITDTSVTATATVELMPFAIQGTWAATYQGVVWVGKQATVYFSAPGSFTDFSTSSGGGNFTSADYFLQNAWVRGVSANGFLYLIGDSSINYISGVRTTGTPPTTTFTNQNADPEVGTPYPAAVITVGQNILFANSVGVHLLTGAKVAKVSEMLDGVWNSVANFGDIQLSAAKANIFGKKCWMVLSRIVDPVTGTTANKVALWNGDKKWWWSTQDMTLIFIQGQEINSNFTAWGTEGSSLRSLFTTASSAFVKTAQSRLWDAPGGYLLEKSASRFWGMMQYNSTVAPNFTLSVDNEDGIMASGTGASITASIASGIVSGLSIVNGGTLYSNNPSIVFTGGGASVQATAQAVSVAPNGSIVSVGLLSFGSGYVTAPTVTVLESLFTITGPTKTGYFVVPPQLVGQVGELTGMTIRTSAADMSLISAMLGEEIVGYRG